MQARSMENVARLAGGVAHDFNNLLSVISSHARVIARDVADSRLRRSAEVLCQSAEQAAELTRQLMIVGRRERVPAEVLDPNQIVARGRGELILLVEDSAPLRCLIGDLLVEHGYRVLIASEPSMALEMAWQADEPTVLLLTDVIPREQPASHGSDRARQCRGPGFDCTCTQKSWHPLAPLI